MSADPLREALMELVSALRPMGIRLIVGGGYGLLLKDFHIAERGLRTRHRALVTRSTSDIDCFLGVDIITNGSHMAAIRGALNGLGYSVLVPDFQFTRAIRVEGVEASVRVDFLAAPIEAPERVHVSGFRIRPRDTRGLQAHVTPEAFAVEDTLTEIDLSDNGSGLFVYVPHPFAYLILKLMALRDRLAPSRDGTGKYHALDMYTIVAMSTEEEWEEARPLRVRHRDHPMMSEVRAALDDLFAGATAPGSMALRTQARAQGVALSEGEVITFIADLRALLLGER